MSTTDLERDTGLAAMVVTVQPGDHGILADWIDDHLQLDDLATILRRGVDDPRSPDERQRTACDQFRYRQLDRLVLVSMATYRIWQPYFAGQKKKDPTGYVLCLCTPSTAPGGMRRWGRWLPETLDEPAITRLWDDLGKDMPAEEVEE